MSKVRTLLVACILLSSSLAIGGEFHVSTGGSDSHDGKSANAPFATIQKAVDSMRPGCIIKGGVYREAISITNSDLKFTGDGLSFPGAT